MEFSVGTSRWTQPAKVLSEEHGIPSLSFPGKELDFITDKAIALVKKHRYDLWDNTFVYVTAGLTNLTEKVTHGYGRRRYQEVLFYEESMTAVGRVFDSFVNSRDKILSHSIIPVYSTVAPMSFWDWNYSRLCQEKTTRLDHTEDYLVMQGDLEEAIIELNNKIREMNAQYSLLTPRIADYVFQKKGANDPHRFRHNRFVDGVHPDPDTVKAWTKEMLGTMSVNHVKINHDFYTAVHHPSQEFDLIDISDHEDSA